MISPTPFHLMSQRLALLAVCCIRWRIYEHLIWYLNPKAFTVFKRHVSWILAWALSLNGALFRSAVCVHFGPGAFIVTIIGLRAQTIIESGDSLLESVGQNAIVAKSWNTIKLCRLLCILIRQQMLTWSPLFTVRYHILQCLSTQLVDESIRPQSWRRGSSTLLKLAIHFLIPRQHFICWLLFGFFHSLNGISRIK